MGKVKRTLSILLAVAMVVTCVPQTGLSALAANETPGITEAAETETAEVKVETPENDSEVTDDADTEQAEVTEEGNNEEETTEGEDVQTPAEDDEQAEEPVVDGEAAEDGESEDAAKDLMDAEPYKEGSTYNVNVTESQCFTLITGGSGATEVGEDYVFTFELADGYKDPVATAYTGNTLEDNKSNAIIVTVDGPDEGVYTCTIANSELIAIEDGIDDITVEISATEIQSYTLTIPQAADVDGVSKVEYAKVPEGDGTDWKEVGASIDPIEEDTDVYVRVTADEGYTYTVTSQYAGDTEAAEAAKVDGKDYYKFTMSKNLTLTITASEIKTSYEVVVNGTDTSDKAELTWVPENLVTTADGKSTVPADTNLTFKVNVKEADVETDKIDTVTYKIGASGTEKEITPDEEGVYTIDKAEITDTVTITVTTAPYQDYAISFDYDAEEVETPAITAGGKALDAAKWDATEKKAIVSEKDEISFKLSMKQTSNYEIDKVTYGAEETPITPAEDGTYTLGKVTKDTTVTVSLKVNEEKANRLTLATEGSARGYSVTFIQDGEIALDKEIVEGNPYRNGDKIVTLTSTFYALITPGRGFALNGVTGTADGVTYEKQTTAPEGITLEDGQELYKITYTKAAALELKVATTVIPSEVEQTVLFANKSGRLTYAVDLGEKITKKQNTVNTYVVAAGATAFDFTVNAAIGYAPKVSYEDENGDPVDVDPESKDGTLARDGKTKAYEYKLTVGELPNNTVITLNAEVDKQTVSVIYSDDEVYITAIRIGAKEYDGVTEVSEPDDNGLVKMDLKVPHGETITISAEANDNCKITNVTTQLGTDSAKKVSSKPAGFETSLKADVTTGKAWSLNITSEKLYAGELYDDIEEEYLESVKNVYTVDYDHTFTVSAFHGMGVAKLSEVEVLAKKGGAAIDGVTVKLAENKESASFTLNAAAATAKDLLVNLHVEGSDVVVTLALNVLPVITKVTVTGVKNGAVEQTVDTWKDYAVKVDPKTANSGVLHAVVDPAVEGFDVSFDTEENKLWIKTPQTLDQTATVKFYTVPDGKTDVEANRTDIASANGGVFTVTSVAQLSDKVKPTMKLASSDDTTLTLALGAPKTVVDAAVGTVLYEVKITSKGAAKDTKNATATEANVKTALGTTGTKTFYVPKEVDALSQEETFTVNGAAIGAGDAWEYNVTVTLVQAKESIYTTIDTVPTLIGAKSSTVDTGNKPFATKVPYYEDKLTLKKGTTTIYTGQQESFDKKTGVEENGVLIATAQFGKNTTYTDNIWAEDDHENGPLDLYVEGNKVYARANQSWYSSNSGSYSYTELGKHKITVHADAANGMHSATATVDVTVVEGIEELQVNVPTTSLYKEDKKAASLKATVDYNPYGDKEYAPKTKKVEWEIHDIYGNNVNEDPESYLYKKVTVKNGNVSVDKNFVVSSNEEDNQFYVYVKAADYYGNETEEQNYYPITITNQAQDIGELVLATEDSENKGYKVLARDGQSVTAAQLKGAKIFVLKRGTPEKTFQWEDALDSDCFTFTSSNKAVVIDEYDNVYVDKPAKNVKLTATANDGSKQKVTMTLTVDYDTVNEGELGLKIETWTPSYQANDPDSEAALTFDGTTAAQYYVSVVKKVGNEWTEISDYTDFKVTAKDAKFITKGYFNQRMDFVNTKKDAKITLTYSVPNGSGKFVKKTRDYTVTNTGYDTAKAPKVTLTGSLIAVYTDDEQVISGTVTPDKSVSEYSFKGKQVKVEPDWTAATAKNLDDYYTLNEHISDCYVDETGKLTLKFAGEEEEWDGEKHKPTSIPAGTYKLKVTTGTWNYDTDTVGGEFVPDSQAASVTLKAVARKVVKGSFKPTTTYTLSMLDSSVTLTGKGKDVKDYNFYEVENDNVKGAKNHFTKYFELETDWDTHISVLKLNSTELSKPEYNGKTLSEIIPAEDRTAYVTWGAHLGTDLWGNTSWYSETVKITVKLTDKTDGKNDSVKKYAASNATVLGDKAVVTANIAVTADGKPVELACAYAEDTIGPGFTSCYPDMGGIVVLQSKLKPTVGKHKIDLYIVPADSYWAPVINNMTIESGDLNALEAAKNKAIMANGVKLTVTVDVKDPANTKDKIKVGNTNVVFTNEQYSDDGFGNYWADIPYTKVIDCEIDEIKVADPSNALNGLINFSPMQKTDDYENVTGIYISASINKKELSDAISATGSKLKWEQKNIAVDVTVTFKSGKADENAPDYGDEKKAETIKFKVTLPKEPKSTTFAKIVDDVKAHQDDIMKVDLPDDWSALDSVNVDDDGYSELDYVVHGIREQVYNNLKEYVPGDSDVMIEFEEDMDIAYNAGYDPATTGAEGSLIVPMALVDLTTGTATKDAQGNVTGYDFADATRVELESEEGAGGYKFVIPKASLSATDSTVTSKIGDLMREIGNSEDITISNATTVGDIRAYLREGAKDVLGTNLVLWVTETNRQDATDQKGGHIYVKVIVRNKNGGDDSWDNDDTAYDVAIEKLPTVGELATKIDAALAVLSVSNKTTQDDIKAEIEKVIAENNTDVEFAWAKKTDSEDDDFTIVKAEIPDGGKDGVGSITGKIVLTNSKSATGNDGDKKLEHSISIEIPALKKSDEAITAVASAAIGEANAKKFAESNVEATVRQAVLDAASKAVENDPYVVSFKVENEKELFDFKPVKWNEDGEISYTLEVKEEGTEGKVVEDSDSALVQAKVTLTKNPDLQTLAEAKAEVEKKLTDAGETVWNSITSTTTEEVALNTVQTTLEGYVTSSVITVKVTKVSFTAATVKAGGELKCTWSLTKEGETPTEPVELTITTEMLAQAKADVEQAAKGAAAKITVTTADFDEDGKADDKQAEIKKAVEDALAEKFTVEVKTDLNIAEAPTLNKDGKAKIVFSVKEGAEDESPVEVTCDYTLPELTQTVAEALDVITKAIAALTVTNESTGETVLQTLQDAVATTLKNCYSIDWSKEEGKGFVKTEADGETPAKITGTIVITQGGNEVGTADVDIVIPTEH